MVHRATGHANSFRAYSGGGARSSVDTIDDSTLMQSMAGNVMKGEFRQGVEAPQNYGSSSVCLPSVKDMLGKIQQCAEVVHNFLGGSRSYPIAGNMDDRRHRLMGLDPGDNSIFTTQGRKQQIQMAAEGIFHSLPMDKTMRMALLDEQTEQDMNSKSYQNQQKAQQTGGRAHDAAREALRLSEIKDLMQPLVKPMRGVPTLYDPGGTGSATEGTNAFGSYGGGQRMGQKSLKNKNQQSKRFMHMTKDETAHSGTNVRHYLDDGNGYYEVNTDKNVYCGALKSKGQFAKVVTTKGPAKNVFGKIG
jgi:phage gp45-like